MKKIIIFIYVGVQDSLVWMLIHNKNIHKLLFAPGIENFRWVIGRWRAWRTFEMARKRVPAYKKFLRGQPKNLVSLKGWTPDLSSIPEMDKHSYILQYANEEKCKDGMIPRSGVVVDESSGSSGTPTSWVRGKLERFASRAILQTTFAREVDHPVFVLNAFSLGAWATGMNVSMSLVDVCIIKSTGPDMVKIIDTIKSFGPKYDYVVMGYPPFLKTLSDNPDINWKDYNVIAGFGGESLSENMRDYLLKSFKAVFGSYGASDLEINIAAENDFTIALRRELVKNKTLCEALLRTEWGVLPMVFQYNSFGYVIESNDKGELLITIASADNISPRIRYNIHDRGHVLRIIELKKLLKEHNAHHVLSLMKLDLPILFYYGRSDLTVSYYGAKITPDSIREILYEHPELMKRLNSFRLISYEDKSLQKHLLFALEMNKDESMLDKEKAKALESEIIEKLRIKNLDFASAYGMATPETAPSLRCYPYKEGPFAGAGSKLKNEYVATLEYEQAHQVGLV